MQSDLSFAPHGDTGLAVVFGTEQSPELTARLMALRAAIEAAGLAGLIESVPTYTTLLLHYDPTQTGQGELKRAVLELAQVQGGEVAQAAPRRWHVPICFENEEGEPFASDLAELAARAGKSLAALQRLFLEAEQQVYLLGFAPGQPYMGELPAAFAVPRREQPIPHVPAGTVLVATGKTVIYPVDNPTGWYRVGRTPLPLFNPDAQEPTLLKPGDRVGFWRVEATDYAELSAALARGTLDAQQWRLA